MARHLLALVLIALAGRGRIALATGAPCAQPPAAAIRAAVLSVYYFAYSPIQKLHIWKPIPLGQASEILRCDQSFGARARRRRAIIKLAPRMQLAGGAPSPALAAEIGAALSRLDVPVPDLLEVLTARREDTQAQLEQATALYLDSTPGPWGRLCCARVTYCDPVPAGRAEDPGSVFFTIDVARPLSEVRPIMDPQAWDSCAGTFFQDTHRIGDTCPTQPPVGVPAEEPRPAGTAWSGALYEHFEANFQGGNKAMFKNLLKIATQVASGFHFDYGLCAPSGSLESDVLGNHSTPGILREDCGFSASNQLTSTSTVVSGLKKLQFGPIPGAIGLNVWVNLGLESLVDQVADVGVCCGEEGLEPAVCSPEYANDQDCLQARTVKKLPVPPAPLCK